MIKFQSPEVFTVHFPSGHGYVNTARMNWHGLACRFCNCVKDHGKDNSDETAEMQQNCCECNQKAWWGVLLPHRPKKKVSNCGFC